MFVLLNLSAFYEWFKSDGSVTSAGGVEVCLPGCWWPPAGVWCPVWCRSPGSRSGFRSRWSSSSLYTRSGRCRCGSDTNPETYMRRFVRCERFSACDEVKGKCLLNHVLDKRLSCSALNCIEGKFTQKYITYINSLITHPHVVPNP